LKKGLVIGVVATLLVVIILLLPIVPVSYEEREPYTVTETYTETVPGQVTVNTEWKVAWKTITAATWGATVGSSTFPSTFDYDWGTGKVFGDYSDYIGFEATAIINVPREGLVSFTIGNDDSSILYLETEYGRQRLVYNQNLGKDCYTTKNVVVEMSAGKHNLTLLYCEFALGARVSFTADKDVLTWRETRYEEVQRQRIVTKYRTVTRTKHISFLEYLLGRG